MMRITMPNRAPKKRATGSLQQSAMVFDRAATIAELADTIYDVVVVGGGITGAYAALDAASRGLRTALIEQDDFASGTSSKSSKMIHGGLRYIEQGNLPLVRRSLLERQRFRKNAPHLVQRLPFLFPLLSQDGVFDPRLNAGFEGLLWTYDFAGGWRIGRMHERLSVPEVLSHAPMLRSDYLTGGLMYYDARTDDARLTLTIARTAAAHGATVLNGAKVVGLMHRGDRVRGVKVSAHSLGAPHHGETTTADTFSVRARVVINATGVWTDDLDAMAEPNHEPQVRPAKGVHIVVPWVKIRNDCTVTVPIPGRARRATCTRWGDVVVLGTTDTDYAGSVDDVNCVREEMEFLLDGARMAFDTNLDEDDVVGSIGGLRPLVGSREGATLDMSRDHKIAVSAAGMVTVTGGKLTTARHMGELAVDKAITVLGKRARCRTISLPLLGAEGYDAEAVAASGGLAAHLGARYGSDAHLVSDLIVSNPELAEPVVAGLPNIKAEVVYAIRSEFARSVDDILSRRIRARVFARDASVEAAPVVGAILGSELGLTQTQVQAQTNAYRDSVAHEKSVLFEGVS